MAGLRKDAVREKLNALLTAARALVAEQEAELLKHAAALAAGDVKTTENRIANMRHELADLEARLVHDVANRDALHALLTTGTAAEQAAWQAEAQKAGRGTGYIWNTRRRISELEAQLALLEAWDGDTVPARGDFGRLFARE